MGAAVEVEVARRRNSIAFRCVRDDQLAAYVTAGSTEVAEAMHQQPYSTPDQPLATQVRTLEDMSPEEVRAIEKLYGVRVCFTAERRRKE